MAEEKYSPRLHRPATLDHLRKKEPVQKTISVILSDSEMEAHDRALRAYERLILTKGAAEADIDKAKAELDLAREALDEVTVSMTFRSIGRKAYDGLVSEHPPTDEQKDLDYTYNPETFSPALIAAACVEPRMTLEEATEIFDTWNGPEVTELFFTAVEVNSARRTAELGKGSGPTGA